LFAFFCAWPFGADYATYKNGFATYNANGFLTQSVLSAKPANTDYPSEVFPKKSVAAALS